MQVSTPGSTISGLDDIDALCVKRSLCVEGGKEGGSREGGGSGNNISSSDKELCV